MKSPTQSEAPRASRRGFFLTASAAGAAVAAVSALRPVAEAPAEAVKPPPARGGGYTLSEHVKRYYKTTLV